MKIKLRQNWFIKIFLISVAVFSMTYLFFGFTEYFLFKKTAQSMGGLPYIFGGRIISFIHYAPSDVMGYCENCPFCAPKTGAVECGAYDEIVFTGTENYVCPLRGFPYLGGYPLPGGSILGGGSYPTMPYVIGVSAPVADANIFRLAMNNVKTFWNRIIN